MSFELEFDRPEIVEITESELDLDEFEIFWSFYTAPCSRHFGTKPLLKGSETLHGEIIYIVDVQPIAFSLIWGTIKHNLVRDSFV